MFDTYYQPRCISESVHTSVTTTINEHRAPTDESIKLYKELVEKANNSVIDVFKVTNTPVDLVVSVMQAWHIQARIARYKITINNEVIFGDVEIPSTVTDRPTIAKLVVGSMSQTLALRLTQYITPAVIKDIFFN